MRLLSFVMVSLLAATASADPLSFEVVRLLPETQQALVYDRGHNTHVLLSPGSTFDDYVVVEINGVGLTVQKQQERFTVHPKAAKGLALDLEPKKGAPPAIYSKTTPTPAPQVATHSQAVPGSIPVPPVATTTPAQAVPGSIPVPPVATTTQPQAVPGSIPVPPVAKADKKKSVGTDLASLLTESKPRVAGPSQSAKLKP